MYDSIQFRFIVLCFNQGSFMYLILYDSMYIRVLGSLFIWVLVYVWYMVHTGTMIQCYYVYLILSV